MSEENVLVNYLESSFLKDALEEPGLNDVAYNGESFFLETSICGRKPWPISVSKDEVGAFLRQIANISERQFSYLNPILDVSFGRYRLSACFLSLTRVKDAKSYSFSLRVENQGSILSSDSSFFRGRSKEMLLDCLAKRESLVIGGETGSGKTELQKFLLMQLEPSTRVLVIDNVEELELIRGHGKIDLTTWVVDPQGRGGDCASLIRTALRFNPDYLVLAEARGGEMFEALNCAMSGHPVILTVHSSCLEAMPSRLARLAQMRGQSMVYSDLLEDVMESFGTYVFVRKKRSKGKLERVISRIGRMEGKGMKVLYQEEGA